MTYTPNGYRPSFGHNISNTVTVDGYSIIRGTTGAVQTTSFSPGATVALTSTGLYTVTLTDVFTRIIPHAPAICVPGGGTVAVFAQIGTWTSSSFTIRTVNGSGALTTPTVDCALSWSFTGLRA